MACYIVDPLVTHWLTAAVCLILGAFISLLVRVSALLTGVLTQNEEVKIIEAALLAANAAMRERAEKAEAEKAEMERAIAMLRWLLPHDSDLRGPWPGVGGEQALANYLRHAEGESMTSPNTAWARETPDEIERRAKEECAKICDANDNGSHMLGADGRLMARRIGAAIRSTLPPTSKAE